MANSLTAFSNFPVYDLYDLRLYFRRKILTGHRTDIFPITENLSRSQNRIPESAASPPITFSMHACTQPATRAVPLRRCGGARTSHRRAPLRINAVSNVSGRFNQKNKHGFTNVLIVPKKLEHEADRLVKSHERWVNQTHVVGPDGDEDDFGHPRLLEYYVTKGPEVVDALDPRSGAFNPQPGRSPPRSVVTAIIPRGHVRLISRVGT